jgi:2-polyprenyl-3-methyl-5-hydroxy-6-metoxy-1,4-benzoquinol methylase
MLLDDISLIHTEPVWQCPLCGPCLKTVIYEKVEDRLFHSSGEWNFSACNSCGLIFLDPRPKPDEIHKTYTPAYADRKPPAPERKSNDRLSRFKRKTRDAFLSRFYGYDISCGMEFYSYLLHLIPFLKRGVADSIFKLRFVPGGRLLDVGCGVGDFLNHMTTIGWDAEGVDTDDNVVEICTRRSLRVRAGGVEDQHYLDATFDVIVMKHLIEHVTEPLRLLNECRRILKPGGILLLLTPNKDSCAHKKFGRYWLGLDVARHLHIFSAPTVTRLIEKAGLELYSLRSTLRISRFVWLASYCNSRLGKSIYCEKPSFLTRSRGRLFMVQLWLESLFNDWAGDELEAVAKKK